MIVPTTPSCTAPSTRASRFNESTNASSASRNGTSPKSSRPVGRRRLVEQLVTDDHGRRLFTAHALEVELGQRLVAQRAAVDGQLDAGHVLRLVRREVHDAGGDVGRLAEARDHDVLLERGAVHCGLSRIAAIAGGAGEDEADDDRVRADVVLAEVDRHLAGQRVDGALRRVVRGPVRERRLRRARRDVDDRAVARLAHLGDRVLRRPHACPSARSAGCCRRCRCRPRRRDCRCRSRRRRRSRCSRAS